jgi:hypothetical protein
VNPGVRKGEPWGSPATGPPDGVVTGDDAALAAWVLDHPDGLARFEPTAGSDLAASVGLQPGAAPTGRGTVLPLDVLALDDGGVAVNMVVLGAPPDRLGRWTRSVAVDLEVDGHEWVAAPMTTVVVAVGQWWRGYDLVPRGHPGDGRAEVQAYRLGRRERAPMRQRLSAGTHLPHPRIDTRAARTVVVTADRPLPVVVDGVPAQARREVRLDVRAQAYRLLV